MTPKLIRIATILLLCNFYSCGQLKSDKPNETQIPIDKKGDSSNFTVLEFDTVDTWLFKNVHPITLQLNEIGEVEAILKECVDAYNAEQRIQFDSISKTHPGVQLKIENFLIDLSKNKRQYYPVINEKGQKEVWVNGLCDTQGKDWKHEMIIVKDGGNCYFSVVINLTTKTHYRLIVNDDV